MHTTEAWVLHRGPDEPHTRGILERQSFSFDDINDTEVLVEPIFGCFEGNMGHALDRNPIDICRQRNEDKVVIGNAGVVRVVEAGAKVQNAKVGDLCMVFSGTSKWNRFGFMAGALGYDAPKSIGLLAKTTKLHERQVIPLPSNTAFRPEQWAAFSLRYVTAWGNWKVAHGTFRSILSEKEYPHPYVVAWGGGVALAQLELAKLAGYQCVMLTSDEKRIGELPAQGIQTIDRRQFSALHFSPKRYHSDPEYKKNYSDAEKMFLESVARATQGEMASIFIDHIGEPVFKATLKALASPSVITTAGWKLGMQMSMLRAFESGYWHQHVHTSYARYPEAIEAMQFAQEHNWMPPLPDKIYGFDDIPQLTQDYAEGKTSYFPIFQVNPL